MKNIFIIVAVALGVLFSVLVYGLKKDLIPASISVIAIDDNQNIRRINVLGNDDPRHTSNIEMVYNRYY